MFGLNALKGIAALNSANKTATSKIYKVLRGDETLKLEMSCCFHRLFMEILNSCSDCDEIQFKEDGNWAPMRSKREVQEVSASYNGVDSGM